MRVVKLEQAVETVTDPRSEICGRPRRPAAGRTTIHRPSFRRLEACEAASKGGPGGAPPGGFLCAPHQRSNSLRRFVVGPTSGTSSDGAEIGGFPAATG
jgi:hypothetical protein